MMRANHGSRLSLRRPRTVALAPAAFCRVFYPGQQRCHLGMETPALLSEDYGALLRPVVLHGHEFAKVLGAECRGIDYVLAPSVDDPDLLPFVF